jgi:hypothetical protein
MLIVLCARYEPSTFKRFNGWTRGCDRGPTKFALLKSKRDRGQWAFFLAHGYTDGIIGIIIIIIIITIVM